MTTIIDPIRCAKALFLTVLGWVFVLSASSLLGYIFLSIFALLFWIMGAYNLAKGVYLEPYAPMVHVLRWALVWVPIILLPFFFSAPLLGAFVFGVLFNISLRQTIKPPRQQPLANTRKSVQKDTTSSVTTKKISMSSHASHLDYLLSRESKNILLDVIEAINKLQSQSDFLEKNHPFLASSVSELIHDLTQNTIVRLDTLAKNFVNDSKLDEKATQMFSVQHEPTIKALLLEHLEEINELNQSIIEKQMAGFDDIGNSVEKQFREAIMELRIILKWFIAQAPENTVSSHEVILKKLEETTLKQMQTAFYKPDTTEAQKQSLHEQVQEMIAHFKSQAGRTLDTTNSADNLLQITHEPNQAFEADETQNFIDFNKQYVKQLKQHWH